MASVRDSNVNLRKILSLILTEDPLDFDFCAMLDDIGENLDCFPVGVKGPPGTDMDLGIGPLMSPIRGKPGDLDIDKPEVGVLGPEPSGDCLGCKVIRNQRDAFISYFG